MRYVWLALLTGCYAPDPGDCAFKCAGGEPRCPDGQVCVGELCRDPDRTTQACPGQQCVAWSYAPRSIGPCAAGLASPVDWTVTYSLVYNTEQPPADGTTPVGVVVPIGNVDTLVLRLASFTVLSGKTLTFEGRHP